MPSTEPLRTSHRKLNVPPDELTLPPLRRRFQVRPLPESPVTW